MSTRRRKSISIKSKLQILKKIDDGAKIKDICNEYGIHKSVVSKIRQNKENLNNFATRSMRLSSSRKQLQVRKFEQIEDKLYKWFLIERERNNVITNNILQIKALEFYNENKLPINFSASSGWLENFKKRYGIRLLKICGEKLSSNKDEIGVFYENFKRKVKERNLRPDQIYNCDETALVYKNINDKTLVHQGEKSAPGRKNSKERVTIMPCVNATGNHKLLLQMIGKAKTPRCFKDFIPPLYYTSSKNAWQTTMLFKNWFFNQFIPEVSKFLEESNLPKQALLLLDNATCHCNESILRSEDGKFEVMFFPPNTTALIQPLDQSIIKSLKTRYRKELLASMIGMNVVDVLKNINLKKVSYMISQAWNMVSKRVICNGFKHLFDSIETIQLNLPMDHFNELDEIPIALLYREVLPDTDMNDTEINSWGEGLAETYNGTHTELNNDVENIEDIDNNEEQNPDRLNELLQSYNLVIEWAEEKSYAVNEIIFLQKLRERILAEKFKLK